MIENTLTNTHENGINFKGLISVCQALHTTLSATRYRKNTQGLSAHDVLEQVSEYIPDIYTISDGELESKLDNCIKNQNVVELRELIQKISIVWRDCIHSFILSNTTSYLKEVEKFSTLFDVQGQMAVLNKDVVDGIMNFIHFLKTQDKSTTSRISLLYKKIQEKLALLLWK